MLDAAEAATLAQVMVRHSQRTVRSKPDTKRRKHLAEEDCQQQPGFDRIISVSALTRSATGPQSIICLR